MSVQAAVPEYHRLGAFNQHKCMAYSSRGWKSKTGGPARTGCGESSLPRLQRATSLHCPHVVERSGNSALSFVKAVRPFVRLRPQNLPPPPAKAPPPNILTSGVSFQHMDFGGTQTFRPKQTYRLELKIN